MSPPQAPIGVGIIGLGYWGPNLLRNFHEVPQARVVAVSDLAPERLAQARRRYPALTATADYRELLRSPEIQAVSLVTPEATHHALALEALEHGKHVMVEKPLTRTAAEGEALVAEAARQGRVLMVGHTYEYSGPVNRIKELLAEDSVGQVRYLEAFRANFGGPPGTDVLWDLAVHDIYILHYLLGAAPVWVSAAGKAYFQEDFINSAHLSLGFPGDLEAHIYVSHLSPLKIKQIHLGCARKQIVYDDMEAQDKIRLYDGGSATITDETGRQDRRRGWNPGDTVIPSYDKTEPILAQCQHFIDCILTGQTPRSDGASGLRVVRVLEAASASARAGGKKIRLDGRAG